MKNLIFILLLIFWAENTNAQLASVLPTSVSIANTSVADIENWSAFSNPANIGYIDEINFGFQYENRFLLSELSTKSLQFAIPTSLINTAFSASYFGFSLYNEILFGIGFSRNFSNKFSLGLQLNYLTSYFRTPNHYFGSFFPQFGLSYALSSNFQLGFSAYNPFHSAINSDYSTRPLPSIFSLGGAYCFSPELVLRFQTDKEISSNFRFACGTEYSMFSLLTVKAGIYHNGYLVPCFGLKSNLGAFSFLLNADLHPLLGLVTLASIQYSLKK